MPIEVGSGTANTSNDEFDIDTARSFKDQNSFVPLPLHQRLLEPVIMRRGVAGLKSLRVLP